MACWLALEASVRMTLQAWASGLSLAMLTQRQSPCLTHLCLLLRSVKPLSTMSQAPILVHP